MYEQDLEPRSFSCCTERSNDVTIICDVFPNNSLLVRVQAPRIFERLTFLFFQAYPYSHAYTPYLQSIIWWRGEKVRGEKVVGITFHLGYIHESVLPLWASVVSKQKKFKYYNARSYDAQESLWACTFFVISFSFKGKNVTQFSLDTMLNGRGCYAPEHPLLKRHQLIFNLPFFIWSLASHWIFLLQTFAYLLINFIHTFIS